RAAQEMKRWLIIALLLAASPASADDQRRHAWELVAQAALAFETWHGEAEIFGTGRDLPRGIRGFSRAGIAGVRDTSENPGAPVLAYTLYNDAAFEHIKHHRLNEVATLVRMSGSVP